MAVGVVATGGKFGGVGGMKVVRAERAFSLANSSADLVYFLALLPYTKAAKRELDALGLFKADLVAFTRYYEFMSQIVDYDRSSAQEAMWQKWYSRIRFVNTPSVEALADILAQVQT